MFAGSGRRAQLLVTLVLTLAVAGTAVSAASGTRYRGKTKQGPKVTFRTTATKVVGFKTSVSALCVSAASGRSVTDIRPVSLPKSPLKNRRFKITFKIPTIALVAKAKGTVKGNSASGTLDVRYTKIIGSTPSGLQDVAACFVKTTWKAKKV
jgi:hypothetical protein